jgi:hypothetical protein
MGLYRASYEVFKIDGELVICCEHLHTEKDRKPAAYADHIENETA